MSVIPFKVVLRENVPFAVQIPGGEAVGQARALRDATALLAEDAANSAAAAQLAESGAVAANGTLYPNIAAGLAATAEGGYFTVAGDGTNTYAVLYRKVSGSEVEIAEYASKAAYEGAGGSALIGIIDGGNVQDAIMAASSPAALLDEMRSFPVGSTLRTANGFAYKVAPAIVTDAHVETAGGVKLYIVGDITPDALGAPCDQLGDDAPFLERAFQIAKSVKLLPQSKYLLASLIGLPDLYDGQTVNADRGMHLYANGADIRVRSPLIGGVPEAIFTSATAKANPTTIEDAYTGKFHVHGGNWTSDNNWAEDTGCVIFNGDRIYQFVIEGGNYCKVNTVVKSFRTKQSFEEYPYGYIQSLMITGGAQFSLVQRIVDARRGININIDNIHCTSVLGGLYFHSDADGVAVTYMKVSGMLFQGGGCAAVLGPVLALDWNGGYCESNTLADAAAAKCDIWMRDGTASSSGVTFKGIGFQPHPDQIADPAFASVRIDYDAIDPIAPAPVLDGCWTTGGKIVTPGKAVLVNTGAANEGVIRNAISPRSTTSARRSTFSGTQNFTGLDPEGPQNAGIVRVAAIDVQYVKSLLASQAARTASGEISILMRHWSVFGGVVIGVTKAVVGFVMMGASEGVSPANSVNDAYMSFWLERCVSVASGQPIDNLGANTQQHFTNPEMSVVRAGDNYFLRLNGYAPVAVPNYGAATVLTSHITVQVDALNNSPILGSPLALS